MQLSMSFCLLFPLSPVEEERKETAFFLPPSQVRAAGSREALYKTAEGWKRQFWRSFQRVSGMNWSKDFLLSREFTTVNFTIL